MPFLTSVFGNAASRTHSFGFAAEGAVGEARQRVGDLIGAAAEEIVWTSGATEADNLAIRGAAEFHAARGRHIVTSQIEHKAVLDTCKYLEGQGYRVTYVPVDTDGRIHPEAVRESIAPDTILISIMLANNEIGVLQPVVEIGRIAREKGVLFHVDAVQGAGKIPFNVALANADLVSLSAHKMYGPKGVGALYVRNRPRARIAPLMFGGGHERGLRSGTLPVPLIVGFGKACEVSRREMPAESERVGQLRDRLKQRLFESIDAIRVNGSLAHRLPGNLNVTFSQIEAEALMMSMKDIAVSSGSACTSASLEPSYVLRACGVDEESAYGAIRFGIGRFNTEPEIDFAARAVSQAVSRLRDLRRSSETL